MTRIWPIGLAVALLLGVLLRLETRAADAVAEADEPYRLVVCLKFAEDPLLTRLFVESAREQVQDQLASFFGPLAEVQVVTSGHWLLTETAAGGVRDPALTAELLAGHETTEKLFLVSVAREEGLYQLEWRSLDGELSQVGPVRSRSTPDRQWIAKAVCLAVKQDFPPVAVVTTLASTPEEVSLAFRGGKWRERLDGWLGTDCILQPYWVVKQRGDRLVRLPVPHTLLRIKPESANERALVVSNLSNPWPRTARVVGFQAVKLGTREGRVRLRLVEAEGGAPAVKCSVYANDQGFDLIEPEDSLGEPDPQGIVFSSRVFRHLAYLKISTGGGTSIEVPLPITSEVCDLTVEVPTDRLSGAKSDFQRKLRFLIQDAQTLRSALDDAVREVNRLNDAKRYEEALQQVQTALDFVAPLLDTAQGDLAGLVQQAKDLGLAGKAPLLSWVDDELAGIAERQIELGQTAGSLRSNIELIDAQSRADVLIGLGSQAERDGEIEEAISRYELALGEQAEQPELRQRLDRLKADWQVKGQEHQAARDLIYERWPAAQVTEIEGMLPDLQQALQTLQDVGDRLAALKLVKVTGDKLSELNELVVQLSSRTSEADRQELEQYVNLTQRLADFQQQAGQFARQATGASPPSDVQAEEEEPSPDPSEPASTPPDEEEEEEEPGP